MACTFIVLEVDLVSPRVRVWDPLDLWVGQVPEEIHHPYHLEPLFHPRAAARSCPSQLGQDA